MSTFFIVTGTSSGLGAAFAQLASGREHRVVGLNRSPAAHGESITTDLQNLDQLGERLRSLLDDSARSSHQRFVLINNAATLSPIGEHYEAADVDALMSVNLSAPIILSRAFIDALAQTAAPKRIINLSSGASSRAFHGWSLYCASKAGLDHFGRCLALEQERAPHPVDVLGFSPGVVDTGMQSTIRSADQAQFPDRDRFRELQSSGALASPAAVAEVLLAAALSDRRYAGEVLRREDLP